MHLAEVGTTVGWEDTQWQRTALQLALAEHLARNRNRRAHWRFPRGTHRSCSCNLEEVSLMRIHLTTTMDSTHRHLADSTTMANIDELIEPTISTNTRHLHFIREEQEQCAEQTRDELAENCERQEMKSRRDLRDELIAIEYAKNKRLNKFEQQTNNLVKDLVDTRLEAEWKNHLERLAELRAELAEKDACIQGLRAQIKLLESMLVHNTSDELRISPDEDTEDAIQAEDVNQVEATHFTGESQCLDPQQVTEAQAQDARPTDLPPSAEDMSSVKLVEDTDIFCQDETTSQASTTTSGRSSKTQPITVSIPTIDSSSDSGPIEQVSTSTRALAERPNDSNPESVTTEDSFTFISKRQYDDYEHNKENTPKVSLPEVDRDARNRAFAGLDAYARDIFKKNSPASTPK